MKLRTGRMPGAITLGIAAVVVVAAGAGWAFTVILSPPAGVPAADSYTLATAIEGDVGAHLTLNIAAQWQLTAVGTNEASGVVTTVDAEQGQLAAEGDRLYSVNQRPVVVAQGAIPAYRAIGAAARGADVAQLQAMLTSLGFYSGSADGVAGASTVAAVAQWQRSIGVDDSGEVALGDVIFVPELPARLALTSAAVKRGATLSGGEPVVQWLGESPTFTLPVSDDQSSLIPTGTRVMIDDGAGDTWQAVAAGRSETQTGTAEIALTAPTGTTQPDGAAASICGARCDVVPVDGQTLFTARVVTVESVHGTVVPSAALRSKADQTVVVVDAGGVEHPVHVSAASQGMSVVTGIDAGLSVRVSSEPVGGQQGAPDQGGGDQGAGAQVPATGQAK